MAERPTFSHEQLEQYYKRICLPEEKQVYDVAGMSHDDKLDFLNLLMKHQLCKVPWENLTQHYSWHKVVNVKPQHLFRKIVHQHGRGGYCMEANSFFHTVLLSLGFDVYMCGCRIYSPAKQAYGGWTHVVNIVTIAGVKYLLDGGFGGSGPSKPVPLHHQEITHQIAPAQMRLCFESLRQNLNSSYKVWVVQIRYDEAEDSNWTPIYSFPDFEFLPEDVEAMNLQPWLSPHTFFTHKVVAVRFTTSKECNGTKGPGSPDEHALLDAEIDGAITLNQDVLTWRRSGKKVVQMPLRTESDRIEALLMYFGIKLSDEDVEGIRGTAAEIGAKAPG